MAPDPRPQTLDPAQALARAVAEFNAWRFWDCHETLEDLWRQQQTGLADFYQGLIKVAAGFHHLLRSNHKGAVNLLSGGLTLLQPFRPACLGVDVARLIDDVHPCLDRIVELGPRRLSRFDRSLIPPIHLYVEAPRGP